MTIRLKCWPIPFAAICAGRKKADVRDLTDRTFSIGDVLEFERWDPATNAADGALARVRITDLTTTAGPLYLMGVQLTDDGFGPGRLAKIAVLSFDLLEVSLPQ